MKTLYISDMDGTLLNSSSVLSSQSAELLNSSIKNGALFSVATARTFTSVLPIMSKVNFNIPISLMNGVHIFDAKNKKTVLHHSILPDDEIKIIEIFKKHNRYPLLYFLKNERMLVEYTKLTNDAVSDYVNYRHDHFNKDFAFVKDYTISHDGSFVYAVTLDTYDALKPIFDEITALNGLDCNFYCDTYSNLYFLEISKSNVSKASAALWLKKHLKADKLIVFGDNMNDMHMFLAADECYATENATDEIKKVATGIIPSCDEDAVAKFIFNNYKK